MRSSSAAGHLIYLASPYSHPEAEIREARFQAACRTTAELMKAGHLVFSPIAHTHPVAVAGDLPKGWDFWQRYDHRMIDACDEVAVLQIEGWRESTGVAAEIAYAESIGKPVRYLESTNRGPIVRGPLINARDEWAVTGGVSPALVAEVGQSEPRFGDRLRTEVAALDDDRQALRQALLSLAAAVDQDAAELAEELSAAERARQRWETEARRQPDLADSWALRWSSLRQQIEEAVERLKTTFGGSGEEALDLLDAEEFLGELDRIFGNREDATKTLQGCSGTSSPGDGRTFGEAARDLTSTIRALLPGDAVVSAETVAVREAFVAERAEGAEAEPAEPPSAQIVELMEALKASLAAAGPKEQKP